MKGLLLGCLRRNGFIYINLELDKIVNTHFKEKNYKKEDQSTEHYVKNCDGIEKEVFNGINRDIMYSAIQTLDCDERTFLQTTYSIQKIYDLINK